MGALCIHMLTSLEPNVLWLRCEIPNSLRFQSPLTIEGSFLYLCNHPSASFHLPRGRIKALSVLMLASNMRKVHFLKCKRYRDMSLDEAKQRTELIASGVLDPYNEVGLPKELPSQWGMSADSLQ